MLLLLLLERVTVDKNNTPLPTYLTNLQTLILLPHLPSFYNLQPPSNHLSPFLPSIYLVTISLPSLPSILPCNHLSPFSSFYSTLQPSFSLLYLLFYLSTISLPSLPSILPCNHLSPFSTFYSTLQPFLPFSTFYSTLQPSFSILYLLFYLATFPFSTFYSTL